MLTGLAEPTAPRPEIVAADAGQLRGWEVFVQDLPRLLEIEPEPVLLMGHSMGGAVVLQSYRGRGAFTD